MSVEKTSAVSKADALLVGAGIMSAHLGTLLKLLEPSWDIQIIERADGPATESSDPWNNAGTGHAALCELNYTPQNSDGSVDISKAVGVNEKFQISRQWWSYAIKNNILHTPKDFINPTSHVSFVTGTDNIYYLKKRYEALRKCDLFEDIQFSQDKDYFTERFPLMGRGRDFDNNPVAISWHDGGTDLNYGSLTKQLLGYLADKTNIFYGEEVTDLDKQKDGSWIATIHNLRTGGKRKVHTPFVFIGGGGASLRLLQKSGIKEGKGIGGFPISGVFARCTNDEVIAQHSAKVYGKASVGAPPMSVPHLDTRVIDGKRGLLFGPFAGWSPKFLKAGSFTDLFMSVKPNNLIPMTATGLTEFSLVSYLVKELAKTFNSRIDDLKQFYPLAHGEDWEMITAGQRVQVIRKSGRGGALEFGTAVIASEDGSLATLLGASPGASVVVSAMIEVLQKHSPQRFAQWEPRLKEMIPSLGTPLATHKSLFQELTQETDKVLQLDNPRL